MREEHMQSLSSLSSLHLDTEILANQHRSLLTDHRDGGIRVLRTERKER